MRQRTYGGVGSPAREGGLTRLKSQKNKLILNTLVIVQNGKIRALFRLN